MNGFSLTFTSSSPSSIFIFVFVKLFPFALANSSSLFQYEKPISTSTRPLISIFVSFTITPLLSVFAIITVFSKEFSFCFTTSTVVFVLTSSFFSLILVFTFTFSPVQASPFPISFFELVPVVSLHGFHVAIVSFSLPQSM